MHERLRMFGLGRQTQIFLRFTLDQICAAFPDVAYQASKAGVPTNAVERHRRFGDQVAIKGCLSVVSTDQLWGSVEQVVWIRTETRYRKTRRTKFKGKGRKYSCLLCEEQCCEANRIRTE